MEVEPQESAFEAENENFAGYDEAEANEADNAETFAEETSFEDEENTFEDFKTENSDDEYIVIKPFGDPLKSTGNYLGATLLGDGSVIPVLDLIYLCNKNSTKIVHAKSKITPKESTLSVMIVDDSPSVQPYQGNHAN